MTPDRITVLVGQTGRGDAAAASASHLAVTAARCWLSSLVMSWASEKSVVVQMTEPDVPS